MQMTYLEKIEECIFKEQSFVLQGGAGSGKTEALKDTIILIREKLPKNKIVCITHTNKAVNEIKERVKDSNVLVSTIHSFLASFIKNYKKDSFEVFKEINQLDTVECIIAETLSAEDKKNNFDNYKRSYLKYKKIFQKIYLKSPDEHLNKKQFDQDYINVVEKLNDEIKKINKQLIIYFNSKDFNEIHYNNTPYDSFSDLGYGHDSLLLISCILIKDRPLLKKIFFDKFNNVLIDEYQDTSIHVIDVFLSCLNQDNKIVVGLFGDSMQSIYEEGVGNVNRYVDAGLVAINKEDNFRCSYEVVELLNKLRSDGIVQKVHLKKFDSENYENEDARRGAVLFYYKKYEGTKVNAFSSKDEKEKYNSCVDDVIKKVQDLHKGATTLMLTNSSISLKCGFKDVYDIFSSYYLEPIEHIESTFGNLSLHEIYLLIKAFKNDKYNFILSYLKNIGYPIRSVKEKERLIQILEVMSSWKEDIWGLINFSVKNNLIKDSIAIDNFKSRSQEFLDECSNDKEFQNFKAEYLAGKNTYKKYVEHFSVDEVDFEDLEHKIKKEAFYYSILETQLKWEQVYNFYEYVNEEKEYFTMHKTKGTGIENVIVVLDEFFWTSKYRFKNIFERCNDEIDFRTLKILYVACSRAKKNLILIRLAGCDEIEKNILPIFPNAIEVSN